ncbi:MAG: F0F1 ATP synthase subunit alpha [Eubacterium sp.]|nr:F0F1 ATP synthase subunit alpha [Eubacterium sp.]
MIDVKEISERIRRQIEDFDFNIDISDFGTVVEVGDDVAYVDGLYNIMSGELLEFPSGVYGIALNLEADVVGVLLLGSDTDIKEGDIVRPTGKQAEVPVGEEFLGRVVDPLGNPIDGGPKIKPRRWRNIESKAPDVLDRRSVYQPLQTGIKAIDSMIPIGKGQRELIIGDRQTGKSTVAVDTIINQRGKDVICIYVAIGKKRSNVARFRKIMMDHGALDYTIIVSATASDAAPMQYIAPYAGCAMAEYFMHKGKDVLIVYDDLSKHAVAYREMSLLLRRPPGREAFPGDVFYLHSRLLERAAKLSDALGGGSITAIPIVETQAGDVSAYIPTNIISITDGQVFLESDLFFAGQRPPINAGISVSRVGGKAQTKAMKKVSSNIRLALAQYRELQSFMQFGSDVNLATRRRLEEGRVLMEVLNQDQYQPISVSHQVMILYAAVNGYLQGFDSDEIKAFEKKLWEHMDKTNPEVGLMMERVGDMDKTMEEELIAGIKEVVAMIRPESEDAE